MVMIEVRDEMVPVRAVAWCVRRGTRSLWGVMTEAWPVQRRVREDEDGP